MQDRPVKSKAENLPNNTDWFRDAHWGVMCHWLDTPPNGPEMAKSHTTAEEWNRQVAAFDVAKFAAQLESVGAGYVIFTLGQNSGCYCAPNATYDSITGIRPSKCSRRDLIGDLAAALSLRGIRVIVYMASGAPYYDMVARERLEWEDGWIITVPQEIPPRETGKRLAEFQIKWEAVHRDWALRWGRALAGWWIDGCYFSDAMYRHPEPPNYESFTQALKAGNPDAIVAYNSGPAYPVICLTEFEDYTAGEVAEALPVRGYGGVVPKIHNRWKERNGHKSQYHVLSYLGETYGRGQPRFSDDFVLAYTRHINQQEGVVTWDAPITKEGLIPEPFVRQLAALNRGLGGAE